jgi:sugar-specific transcriptional regulator TrmB
MNKYINNQQFYSSMVEGVLENLGLSRNESKIYLELLALGKATATEISKQTKIYRANVYDALSKLIEKGLVAYAIQDKAKKYEAADPVSLLNILKERQLELEKFLPQLVLRKKMAAKQSDMYVYNGLTPAKNTLKELLRYNQPIYVYGTPPNISSMAKGFLQEFHKERVEKKIPMFHVYSKEAEPDFQDVGVNKLPHTFSKHLPDGMVLPMSTTICGDEVQLKFWTRSGSVVVMKSREVADSFRENFNHFWNGGKWVDQKMLTNLSMDHFSPVNKTAFVTSYLVKEQAMKNPHPKEKEFFNMLNLDPVKEDMEEYMKARPQASGNVYDRYKCVLNEIENQKPDLVLVCAAGLSPVGYVLQNKYKVIETDVKDIVLYRRELFNGKMRVETMDVLDKNHIHEIKKILREYKPKKMSIVVEGLTPYFNPEQEKLMHENLNLLGSICETNILFHYYVSNDIIKNQHSYQVNSELLSELSSLHKTHSEDPKEVIAYLQKEYKGVKLVTSDTKNPHKIFSCDVKWDS